MKIPGNATWPRVDLVPLLAAILAVTALVFGIGSAGAQSTAQIMVSNLDETTAGWIAVNDASGDGTTANSFTTGSSAVSLSKIRIKKNDARPTTLEVSIYSDNSGDPGTKLHTLANPASDEDHRDFKSSGFELSANTTYWVVVDLSGNPTVNWAITSSTGSSTAQSGWSVGGEKELIWDTWDGPGQNSLGGADRRRMFAVYANHVATGAPTITGTAQVGQTLTASTTGISDSDGLTNVTYSYQWLADDTEIDGATSSTYTVQSSDNGKVIKVRVTFTDDAGNDETLTSAGTSAVVLGGL